MGVGPRCCVRGPESMYGRSGVEFPHCCGGGLAIYCWGTCASPNRWSLCYNLDIAVLGLVSDEVGCRRGIE